MQVWVEEDFPDKNDIYIFLYTNLSRFYSSYILELEINKLLEKSNGFFGTWTEFYYGTLCYHYLDSVKKNIDIKLLSLKKLYAKLVIRKFMNEYINKRLYRYPDGLRLPELKKHFNSLSKS